NKVDFRIKVLDMDNSKALYPASIFSMLDQFDNLIAEK
ncbi:MAG: hypothetical protein UT64_C0053G0001, partial [Candidatus Falkowbacteria bacterium GW2011_GWF2_39_8]